MKPLATAPVSSSPAAAASGSSGSRRNTTTSSSTCSNVENSSPDDNTEHPPSISNFVKASRYKTTSMSFQLMTTSSALNPELTPTMTITPRTAARVSTDTLPLHDSTFNTAATASPLPSCTTGSSSGAIVTASAAASASAATTTTTTYSSRSGNNKRLTIASSNINPVISSATVGSSNFKTSPFASTTNQSAIIPTSLIGNSSSTTSMSAAKVENAGRITSTGVSSFNNTNILNNTNNNSKAVISTTATASPGSVNNKNRTNTRMSRTQLHAPPPMSSAAMPPAVMSGLTQPSQPHVPLRERRDSHSVTSQLSASDAWQWQENNDPDDQEQALFEQRLCDDIYGVAVRKINQNGKSSLRYVKCCSVDASELEEYYNGGSGHAASSNRSVSSRSWASRNGFSRFLTSGNNGNGGTSSASNSHADPRDFDAHRNLIPGRKIKVLTWGKKKDVKIPLDRFVAVRKGKTTDRTKRNVCPASRILSLITADEAHNSHGTSATTLDIEAPTKLDRDKFARAFARFLNIPLMENDQQHLTTVDMRSVRSDMTPASLHKDVRVRSSSQQLTATGFIHDSTANSSVPDIAMTTTNSYATNGSSFKHAPMPVVTTSGIALEHGVAAGLPPSKASSRIIKTRMNGGGSTGNERNLFSSHSRSNPSSFDVSDQQGSSMHSSSFQNIPTIGTGNSSSSFGNSPFAQQQSQHTPAKEATLGIPLNAPMPAATPATTSALATNSGDDAGSIVSSITGAGFDQDLVEELHMALEKMKVELEESRAEAARAVKVAEQAIQSAENSSSKDWNSTVTHKAAEAAAAAQKKSAEAMARARVAEERLEAEMKNAMLWKKQLENAEEQAGHWQTRAAAAEVQRYAVAESLESERKKNAKLLAASTKGGANKEHKSSQEPFDPFCNSFGELLPDEDEVERLRSKLAMESARRRKLLDELQDLKGSVRVYCRPHPISSESVTKKSTIAVASSEILILDRGNGESAEASGTLSFEFDGILSSDLDQQEVYAEFEAICASVIEGYKVCVMTYGQADAGKTYTMLGKVEYKKDRSVTISDHGIHLRAMKQLFAVLEHRSEMYHDTVTMNLIEVHDERLVDLLAGTAYGESQGKVAGSKRSSSRRLESRSDESSSFQGTSIASNKPKLEIKTNRDGETVVHGVLSVEVSSFDDVCQVWTQSLAARSKRLVEQEIDARDFEMGSHVIASLKILSRNISTGVVTTGKMQFVDFASSDVDSKRSSDDTFKFANRSLNTLSEVVRARSQYQRSVPYRNSTITHILSDSLEGDTKVVLIACISPEEQEVQNTACTLRFAQNMRKVIVGKATRHVSTSI
ncbi:kinesin motor domain containing protein [Nitzschia inconspicua]|uniref:Kinesin motor domain containing protein n=1 Tax=Nitzschia inconspicua TaxID=303405 RepID=A0A9K3LX53_9STRA|nr:kinesin motor domain containing protein [Nitzschia inconspicua]